MFDQDLFDLAKLGLKGDIWEGENQAGGSSLNMKDLVMSTGEEPWWRHRYTCTQEHVDLTSANSRS